MESKRHWSRVWRYLAAFGALTVLGVAAGCGGGGGGAASSAATSAPAATTGGGATTAPAATTPAAPDTVTIAFTGKILTLDPDLALGTHDLAAIHLIGGYLYELRAGGKLVPGLAESGEASSDGLTWTFKLRSGLKFSDGSDLTSADVKATIERSLNDKSNGYIGLVNKIQTVDAPDPQTVIFHLSSPYPSLPTVLAEPALMIMPTEGLAKGKDFFNAPVSAGPYKLVSWGGGNDSTYEVNDLYWGPKPVVKTLKFTTIEDFNTRVAQLQSGQIDFSIDMPPSLIPQLSGQSDIHVDVVPLYGFVSFNMSDKTPPIDNVNVRKAISLALDRQKYIDVVWQGKNTPMVGFWPPSMTGYEASLSTARDVNQAKQLLAGTPCASGCSIELEYTPSLFPWVEQAALIFRDNLKDIGIDAKLVKLEYQTWADHQVNLKYQVSISALYDYVDIPDGMLAYGFTKGGGLNANFSGYSSPEADALAKTAIESSGDARTAALSDINALFLKDQPYATLSTYAYVAASRLPKEVVSLESSGFIEIGREAS